MFIVFMENSAVLSAVPYSFAFQPCIMLKHSIQILFESVPAKSNYLFALKENLDGGKTQIKCVRFA